MNEQHRESDAAFIAAALDDNVPELPELVVGELAACYERDHVEARDQPAQFITRVVHRLRSRGKREEAAALRNAVTKARAVNP